MNYYKILILSLLLIVNNVFANLKVLDQIIAVVNNNIILESDINNMMSIIKLQSKKYGNELPNDEKLRKKIIKKQIMDNIIIQIGIKNGLKISNKEVDKAIQKIIFFNKINMDIFKKDLNINNINYNQFREQIKKELLINKTYQTEINHFIKITSQEINDLANQIMFKKHIDTSEINISYVLFPISEKLNNQQIKNQFLKAYKFTKELKNEKKIGNINNKNYHIVNMGWVKLKKLPSIFIDKIKFANKGDIIGPIIAGSGYYVLKINNLYNDEKIFIPEINISHIMFKKSNNLNDNQIKKKLKNVMMEIINKKLSFKEAVKKYSEDTYSVNQDGYLGWIPIKNFDKNYSSKILSLKKNQISEPIHSKFGWHLIKLIDKRTVDKTIEIYQEKAYNTLYNRKFNKLIFLWQQEQLDNTYISIFNNNVK